MQEGRGCSVAIAGGKHAREVGLQCSYSKGKACKRGGAAV